MNSANMLGGILYYGNHEITDIIINGKVQHYPRWIMKLTLRTIGIYVHRRKGRRKYFRVVNFTHRWFAAGMSTSGGAGLWMAAEDVAKSGSSRKGDTNTEFKGVLAQIGFWWFKFYLYIFLKETDSENDHPHRIPHSAVLRVPLLFSVHQRAIPVRRPRFGSP